MSNQFALTEPRLPPELEHKIFQMVALARPKCIPSLMLVARRVKFWVEPLLYRVVFLDTPPLPEQDNLGLPIFAPEAVKQISHNCLRQVRHLLIYAGFVGEQLQSWLLACTGVTNLCAMFLCTPDILPPISGFTNIKYLTIDVRALCGTTLPLPLFLTVTHLELLSYTIAGELVDCVLQNISLIPNLTHIAINPHLDELLSHPALCANAQLQCIIFFSTVIHLDGSPLLDDTRFVCIDDGQSYYADWLCGAVFGQTYWSFADEFLAARRAGTIDRSRNCIVNGKDFEFVKGDRVWIVR
ncbi:hypothetical protein MSAN_00867000 [Mycena sanguinolenta]|uniref:Uncharacterized protein n=1 Tax=Mycena sanguinolenta TaxID=230812 RepID=A0A8H6YZF4_9AGAR|nr:hypothetical protein MSAN_00867000 [Mycena sanguinolenta]